MLQQVPDVIHPNTNYSLKEAVHLAQKNAKECGRKLPNTLVEVRQIISSMAEKAGHHWITGYAALDVLDAAIYGKDLTEHCRLH